MITLREIEDMEDRSLSINFHKIINLNFIKRLISAIFFVPIIIAPIIIGDYYLIIVYLILLNLITIELLDISKNLSDKKYVYIYLSCAIFTFIFFIIQLLAENTAEYFILTILTIWIFDTFSYIGGTILRGKKIFPKISKGKTYSGLISGFISIIIVYLIIENFEFWNLKKSIFYFLSICGLAFIGDVIVSLIKRSASVKDSSNIIPGHGGFLDRMDSFIFVFFILILSEIF